MPDYPSFTDGKAGLKDPTCRNVAAALYYHWIEDSLKEGAVSIDHILEGEGDVLGSDTKANGSKTGTIKIQLNLATDTKPRPGHIIELIKGATTEYYVVTEMPVENKRGDVVRLSIPVKLIIHPFFTGLQSVAEGDTLRLTKSIATPSTSTLATTPVNHRTGATKAYSALQSDGTAMPAGVAISSSTGVITFTHASLVAGTYTILVTATDTLTPYTARESDDTLILTVTA
jgi:hypothetical protein